MGWQAGGLNEWIYNTNTNVLGLQRTGTPTAQRYLWYELPSQYAFKSDKMYKFEVEVKGNWTNIGLSAAPPWSNSSITGAQREDSLFGFDTSPSSGARYFFYYSPQGGANSTMPLYIRGTGSITGNLTTSPRITNFSLTKIDWLISGYKVANPGTSASSIYATPSDINYNGWSYQKENNIYWWTNKSNPTQQAKGLETNNDYSTNYIKKSVPYETYTLTFEYITQNGVAGNGVSIYEGSSWTSRKLLYTLTQSQYTTQSTPHAVYGLKGNGNYIFISGATTSNPSGFLAAIINPVVSGGYYDITNSKLLLTNSATYSNPTELKVLGISSSAAFSYVTGKDSTINGTPSDLSIIYAQFGNGDFKSGVWENGVWNAGWRVDSGVYEFMDIGNAFRTISDRRWRIEVVGLTSSVDKFEIGDRISISNIVAIDINENRKLLKGYFTITNKSTTSLVVETDVSFPFRRIEKDSPNHMIVITKNVWLSGAFLNGYFSGVWNYGLFKGFTKISEMYKTHWIDGRFDGGHFQSTKEQYPFTNFFNNTSPILYGLDKSLNNKMGLSFSSPHRYYKGEIINIDKISAGFNPSYDGTCSVAEVISDYLIVTDKDYGLVYNINVEGGGISSKLTGTSLIQNFNFTDNNIATKVSSQTTNTADVFLFNSWIDVNYNDYSAVNIGKKNKLFDSNNRVEYTQNNLYGYPTDDILSSISSFRDSHTLNTRNYKLGTKYTIYSDGIGDSGTFNRPFDMTSIGLDNFFEDGWTFSGTNSKYERSVEDTLTNATLTDEYTIKGEELVVTSTASGSLLNNINISIENDRYTVVELEIKSFSSGYSSPYYNTPSYLYKGITGSIGNVTPTPALHFNNINQYSQSVTILNTVYTTYTEMSYIPIMSDIVSKYGTTNVNHLSTTGIKKYEYFFNKPSLSMVTTGVDNTTTGTQSIGGKYKFSMIVDNLKYYEVDMIPFFQYFIQDNIYNGVVTPWQGIAPFIDYENSNFSFIDNISIGLGSVDTVQSYSPVSGVGLGINSGGTGVIFNNNNNSNSSGSRESRG